MSSPEPTPRLTFGSGVMILFLCAFAGVGVVGTVAVAIDWLRGVDTWFWEPTTCTIDASEVVERPDYGDYALEVAYRYTVGGEERVGNAYRHGGAGFDDVSDAEREAARFAAGNEVPCLVDPDDPRHSYLRRANLWEGFWIFVPLLFVAVGGGALWYLLRRFWGSDPEAPPESPQESETAGGIKGGLLIGGFFGLFLLAGAGLFIPFFVLPALQVVEARSWQPVPCEILSSGVEAQSSDDGTTYSVEALYRYEVNGREHRSSRYQFMGGSSGGYEAKAEAVEKIPEGATVTCYVDPDDPFSAVIERGFTSDYLFGLVPLLFAAVGLGGLIFAGRTMRRMKKEAARPSWPEGGIVRLSAAEEVAASRPLHLEPKMGPIGKLGCSAGIALFWNGIVSLFVWQLVENWGSGFSDWFLALFLTPFVLIGLLLLSGIPYGLLALVNPRPRLRMDPGIVRAGEPFEIDWSFRGAASRIRRIRLSLVVSRTSTVTETHDRGVRISTSTEPIDTIEILDRGREAAVEFGSVTFTLPEDAPPTTEGDEAIGWKLKLQGEIAYWPDVVEEYEIRVLPPAPKPDLG